MNEVNATAPVYLPKGVMRVAYYPPSRMLGFAGSAPTYRLCRLWLSVAKPNVYREISFSFPLSPALIFLF